MMLKSKCRLDQLLLSVRRHRMCMMSLLTHPHYMDTVSPLALQAWHGSREGNVGRSAHCFGPHWNISTTIGWIGTKFCTGIHGSQMMCPANFGDYSPGAHMRLIFMVLSEISQRLLDRLPCNLVCIFMSYTGWIVTTLAIPISRLFVLRSSEKLTF